jgi:hypothetical protein
MVLLVLQEVQSLLLFPLPQPLSLSAAHLLPAASHFPVLV